MNKTVTININGLIFNIDDEAYGRLKNYLETIKGYFKNAEGGDDIMTDIEARIAEMFEERISNRKEVISQADVDHIIKIMGQPEDYIDDEMRQENSGNASGASFTESEEFFSEEAGTKRFFRDPDGKMLGGVCSGIGYYFGIDPIIARAAFLIAFIFGSFGFWAYIVLWAITPKALTRADKLRMKGKKVTIDSIRKSVEHEAEDLKKKWKNLGSEEGGKWNSESTSKLQSAISSFFAFLGNILQLLLKSVGKLIGLGFFLFGAFWLFIFITTVFGLYSFDGSIFVNQSINGFTFNEISTLLLQGDSLKYYIIFGILCFIGIPLAALTYSGLRLLIGFNRSHKGIGIGLVILWSIGLITLVLSTASVAKEFKQKESINQQISLPPTLADTLFIDVNTELLPVFEDPSTSKDDNYLLKRDDTHLFIANVNLNIVENSSDSIVVTITQKSRGASYKDAKMKAENIEYHYSINGSKLTFDPFYKIAFEDEFRMQEVYVQIAIPTGKSVYLTQNAGWVIHDIENVNNTWDFDMLGQYWHMTRNGLICNECPRNNSQNYNIIESEDIIDMEIDKLNTKIDQIELELDIEKTKISNQIDRQILKWRNKMDNQDSASKLREYELKIKELEVQKEQKMKQLQLEYDTSIRNLEYKKESLEKKMEKKIRKNVKVILTQKNLPKRDYPPLT